MARVIWTDPVLSDLEDIADCMALDDPAAAERLIIHVMRGETTSRLRNLKRNRPCP